MDATTGEMCDIRFNPHPSRRTGATHPHASVAAFRRVSILTRPGGRVQLVVAVHHSSSQIVSILTRPGGRVQLSPFCGFSACPLMFQSSPVPEDGCNLQQKRDVTVWHCFNPHPSRRTGATGISPHIRWSPLSFQSSPVPEDGCNGRAYSVRKRGYRFQSSPVPEDGCNWSEPFGVRCPGRRFQSSPVPEDGCNPKNVVVNEQISFQSSPVPEDGCNQLFQHLVKVFHAFQSSPVPEDGCNRMTLIQEIKEERVSILTRPGGRVQRRTTALNSTQLSSFSAKQRR